MKLRVKAQQVTERHINAKTGKQYTFREQQAVVALGEEVRVINLSLDDTQQAYPVGEYEVLDASFEVDRNGNLALKRRLALKPLTVSASAPGPARQTG